MHYLDIIEPIFEDFMCYMSTVPSRDWVQKKSLYYAFHRALIDNLEQMSVMNTIDRGVPAHSLEDYTEHMREKTAHGIGKLINENPLVVDTYERDSFMGKEITKTICLVKIGKLKKSDSDWLIEKE